MDVFRLSKKSCVLVLNKTLYTEGRNASGCLTPGELESQNLRVLVVRDENTIKEDLEGKGNESTL